MSEIRNVAVFGAGTMGLGIAGICANAGCNVLLLDLDKETCDTALPRLTAGRAPILENENLLDNIQTGSFENDMDKLRDCQWIVEAIVENVEIKRDVFAKAEQHRSDGSIITTNTSGIPLRDIDTGMPDRLRQDIAVTHFFNPPHIMKLVELVPGAGTDPEVITRLADFLGNTLGKGVVYAKDTVNFIGNRIGCTWINAGMHLGEKAILNGELDIETIDALLGEPVGLPPTGLYGLADLVGIDVMVNVNKNLAENLPENDYCRRFIALTENVQQMVDRGQLGRKTGGGFYKLIRHDDGSKSMEIFDLTNHEWRPQKAITLSGDHQSLESLFHSDSAEGRFVQDLMATTLCYSADMVPEIADDIVNIDRAMRWGFAWEKGPFEMMDQVGAQLFADLVNKHGMSMPHMLQIMLDAGETSFYRNGGTEFLTVDGTWAEVPPE